MKQPHPSWRAAFGYWLSLLAAAFAAAAVRELLVAPRIGEQAAKAIASVFLAFIIFGITLAVLRRLRCRSYRDCLAVGVLWTLLTLAFEFSLGLYGGITWEQMFAEYNVFAGRLWPVVLVSTLVSPVAAFRKSNIKQAVKAEGLEGLPEKSPHPPHGQKGSPPD